MAQQDVRYYLNGMLWEIEAQSFRAVATDGHRLAMSTSTRQITAEISEKRSAIVPRKGILELSRLLTEEDEVNVVIDNNHIRLLGSDFCFTSKLVDGAYPNYERGSKEMVADRESLKQALSRVAILSNEKHRGVKLILSDNLLKIVANNPEQEEAEEEITVKYTGENMEMGFNVSYLLDILNVLSGDNIQYTLSDSNSSALVTDPEKEDSLYVVMPMRL